MSFHDASWSLLFVTIASNLFGYGHLNRCLSLAEQARSEGAIVRFLLFGDERARGRVDAAGYSCRLRPISELEEGAEIEFDEVADAVVSDLIYATFFAKTSPVKLFKQFRSFSSISVAIDALGDQALMTQTPTIDIDLMVIPYATMGIGSRGGDYRLLSGPQFALLASGYAAVPPRMVRTQADRVLVSCGGSDPKGSTLVILQGLETIGEKLQVRVVLGPLFSARVCEEVEFLASNSKHEVVVVSAPETLFDEMLWCDLAIAASGLTKYELAVTGTPALLFSIDNLHDQMNRPFAMLGSSIDLGVNITPELVSKQIAMLLGDVDRRKAMSDIGQQVVDGLGSKRLIAEIRKELSCLEK